VVMAVLVLAVVADPGHFGSSRPVGGYGGSTGGTSHGVAALVARVGYSGVLSVPSLLDATPVQQVALVATGLVVAPRVDIKDPVLSVPSLLVVTLVQEVVDMVVMVAAMEAALGVVQLLGVMGQLRQEVVE
ncbi:hypothetical protein Hamer_G009178, partial [Homarus americanus]